MLLEYVLICWRDAQSLQFKKVWGAYAVCAELEMLKKLCWVWTTPILSFSVMLRKWSYWLAGTAGRRRRVWFGSMCLMCELRLCKIDQLWMQCCRQSSWRHFWSISANVFLFSSCFEYKNARIKKMHLFIKNTNLGYIGSQSYPVSGNIPTWKWNWICQWEWRTEWFIHDGVTWVTGGAGETWIQTIGLVHESPILTEATSCAWLWCTVSSNNCTCSRQTHTINISWSLRCRWEIFI